MKEIGDFREHRWDYGRKTIEVLYQGEHSVNRGCPKCANEPLAETLQKMLGDEMDILWVTTSMICKQADAGRNYKSNMKVTRKYGMKKLRFPEIAWAG